MDNQTITHLLESTSDIVQQHSAKYFKTGLSFNFFRLFKISTHEVKTHSAFIAELLSPKGSHGQGDLFLKLFLNLLNINELDPSKTKVEPEKYIGEVSRDYTKGGRIDIHLSDDKFAVLIENKIGANDQCNQLLRYYNYGEQKFKGNFVLYYLTLSGIEESPVSTGNGISSISSKKLDYAITMLKWLEGCHAATDKLPRLHETIAQYIDIVKELTNQSINKEMKEEIAKSICSSPEYLEAFIEIQKDDILREVKKSLLAELKTQLDKFANDIGLDTKFDNDFGLNKNPNYLKFYYPDSKNKFYISLCFCGYDKNLVLQFHSDQQLGVADKDYLLNKLRELHARDEGFKELWIKWFEDSYRHWDNPSAAPWLGIQNGETVAYIKGKILEIVEHLNGFQLRNEKFPTLKTENH